MKIWNELTFAEIAEALGAFHRTLRRRVIRYGLAALKKTLPAAMNDFSELERELKKLRPVQPSAELTSRVRSALANSGEGTAKVIRPEPLVEFRINWLGLGLGLAAAATFLIFARVDFHPNDKTKPTIASATPSLQQKAAALPNYQATGLTQVVYSKRDEGLVFPPARKGHRGGSARPSGKRCNGVIGKAVRSWPCLIRRRRSR